MNENSQLARLLQLLRSKRWAALATVDEAAMPLASMVAYTCSEDAGVLYLHLSRLAAHTTNLLASGKAALTVSEADSGTGDPQQLARVSLQCSVSVVERDSEEYAAAKLRYLQRLPDAAQLFDFPDFLLFRCAIGSARFVGGFAQARSFSAADLRCAVGLSP